MIHISKHQHCRNRGSVRLVQNNEEVEQVSHCMRLPIAVFIPYRVHDCCLGRCKAGVCFHLFSKRRHASMRPFVESELIRTPLEEICLQCKRVSTNIRVHTVQKSCLDSSNASLLQQLNLAPGGPEDPTGIPVFLSKAMTPPHP
jgi:hypothetical protein